MKQIEKLKLAEVADREGAGASVTSLRLPTDTEMMSKINELVDFANSLRKEKEVSNRQCSICLFTEEDERIDGNVGCRKAGIAHSWRVGKAVSQPQEECQCKEYSCKKDCDKRHTHKGYSCHKCQPQEEPLDVETTYFLGDLNILLNKRPNKITLFYKDEQYAFVLPDEFHLR